MCIAIPPPMGARQRQGSRLWHLLSASPLRLLSMAAVIETVLLLLLPPGMPERLSWLILLGVVLPTVTAGLLLEQYPRWLRGEPPRYVRYGSLFFLLVWGSVLSVAGLYAATWIAGLGLLLLAFAWWLGISTLWHIYSWAPNPQRNLERLMNLLLASGSLGLLLGGVGIGYDLAAMTDSSLIVLLLSQAGMALLLLLRHHLYPRSGASWSGPHR